MHYNYLKQYWIGYTISGIYWILDYQLGIRLISMLLGFSYVLLRVVKRYGSIYKSYNQLSSEYKEKAWPRSERATCRLSPMSIDSFGKELIEQCRQSGVQGAGLATSSTSHESSIAYVHRLPCKRHYTEQRQSSQSGSHSLKGDCHPSDWQASDRQLYAQDPSTLDSQMVHPRQGGLSSFGSAGQ